jgi:hypothetical protein
MSIEDGGSGQAGRLAGWPSIFSSTRANGVGAWDMVAAAGLVNEAREVAVNEARVWVHREATGDGVLV